MFAGIENWLGSLPGPRHTPPPPIALLDDSVNGPAVNDSAPSRSTTYEARYTECIPFQRGTVYIDDPNVENKGVMDLATASLSEVYAVGYRLYKERHHFDRTTPKCLPTAPPDFDGESPIDPQAVAQHVRSLANAYNSVVPTPTPFMIYEQVVLAYQEALKVPEDEVRKGPSYNVIETPNSPTEKQRESDDHGIHLLTWAPQVQSDAFSLSLNLLNAVSWSATSLEPVFDRLRVHPQLARAISPTVLLEFLRRLKDSLSAQSQPFTALASGFALGGMLVGHRGDVGEVLHYLNVLEEFTTKAVTHENVTIPYSKVIVEEFSLRTTEMCSITSPVDCFQEDPVKVNLALGDGCDVQCFCVSADGVYLAAVTSESITVFHIATRSVRSICPFGEGDQKYWNITFSSAAYNIICTDISGQRHAVFSLDLDLREECFTDQVSLITDYADGQLSSVPAPLLPTGSKSSFYSLEENSKPLLVVRDCTPSEAVGCFSICAHVYSDCCGRLIRLTTENDEDLTVELSSNSIILRQGAAVCQGVLPTTSDWYLIHVQWHHGVWSLTVNFATVSLRGPRNTLPKVVRLTSIDCLQCRGHLGSLTVWSGTNGPTTVRNYFHTRHVDKCVTPLLTMPLDEGTGTWLKEQVMKQCIEVEEKRFIWDSSIQVPVRDSIPVAVTLEKKLLLGSRIMKSAYRFLILLPSLEKRADNVVVEVNRDTNSIVRVYQCPRGCSENVYAFRDDESEMLFFQQRFSTLNSVRLYTYHRAESDCGVDVADVPESERRSRHPLFVFLNQLYRTVYIQSFELERVPPESSQISSSTLNYLTEQLSQFQETTLPMKALALVTLTLAHLRKLAAVKDQRLFAFASALKDSNCFRHLRGSTASAIGVKLHHLASVWSTNVHVHTANVLRREAVEDVAASEERLIPLERVNAVVNDIAEHRPGDMVLAVTNILERCKQCIKCGSNISTSTELLTRFLLAAVAKLHSDGGEAMTCIASIVKLFMDYAISSPDLMCCTRVDEAADPVLLTGVLPLFISVANLCPTAILPDSHEQLVELVNRLQKVERLEEESIDFSTWVKYDVYSSKKEKENMWRLSLDFSAAENVTVLRDSSNPEIHVLQTDPTTGEASTIHMNDTSVATRIPGGILRFYGQNENNFTTIAQYNFLLDVSLSSVMREASVGLLLAAASKLMAKPPATDISVVPLFRYGLTTAVLKRNDIQLDEPPRINASNFSSHVLNDVGEGKEFVDHVCAAMRRSIVPTMRPAIQALLAILVHCGLSRTQAEDELKLRWFSGEWGNKLQGDSKEKTIEYLKSFAIWVTESVFYEGDSPGIIYSRLSSVDRRVENSLNCSRSFSERRGSTSSRRSVVKCVSQNDSLEQVRMLLTKGVTPAIMEAILLDRTKAALNQIKGLELLKKLLSLLWKSPTENLLTSSLRVLWDLTSTENGTHFSDALSGAGTESEIVVRRTFHGVVHQCFEVLRNPATTMSYRAALIHSAAQGQALMMFYAILCMPWDETDCELFASFFGSDNDILKFLEGQMNAPTGLAVLTSPWRLRPESTRPTEEVLPAMEKTMRTLLLGAADFTSLSRIFPNDFSVVIPQLQTSRSHLGVAIEKKSNTAILVRADEPWQLTWKEGMPRVYYYEVEIKSAIGELNIGAQCARRDANGKGVDTKFYYSSSGELEGPESIRYPAFSEGEIVGCGIVSTSRMLFYTLNGTFLSYAGKFSENSNDDGICLYPAISFDERSGVRVVVNFGTVPFAYDYRQLHPALMITRGPTWYRVTSTAEMVLHYLTARICAVQDSKKPTTRMALSQACTVVCLNVNSVTSSLMNIGVGGSCSTSATTRVQQAVALSVAEYSIMILISTIRHIVTNGLTLSESISNMVFDAVSVLMLLPLHSVQIATIGLLPEVIVHVKEVPDGNASMNLVSTLFENANCASETKEEIPFVPMWCECDSNSVIIVNVQHAHMIPSAQRSIVLGNVLPRSGVVSFSVKVTRKNMSKGHSLKGGYFIGVSVAGLSPLTPTSNSQSWKAMKPPTVWAIQDTSPQLPHATNPTVKLNNFQRTFGNGDTIRVVVDRDKRCLDFYREDEFLKTLFSDIPQDIDLVPFVQLYNDDAAAVISAGTMTAPITGSALLATASVDVLRSMLTLDPFQDLIAHRLCEELHVKSYPKVTLAVFNSLADPRLLQLRNSCEEEVTVTVSRISDMRCKFSVGGKVNYEHLYNMRTPAKPRITCSFDAVLPASRLTGLARCIVHLIAAVEQRVWYRVTFEALSCVEQDERRKIVLEEKDHWDFLFHGLRVGSFFTVLRRLPTISLLHVAGIPRDYTFSVALSNPSFVFPSHYCGRLATVPNGTKNASTPFIAIAEPYIPTSGRVSLRCQLIRGNHGQILGGGYYFGVCTSSFKWKRKELGACTSEVWPLHDMDDAPWRLRSVRSDATFPIASDPRCIILSGDIIRLDIDRNAGTMHAFRTPMNGEEVPLGLIFDNIPQGVLLYPFVHLFNTDALAVLLPSNSDIAAIRVPSQRPQNAICVPDDHKTCDGCSASHLDSKLSRYWFKCNECADYALCTNCFVMCVHSNHSFTIMGGDAIVHSTTPPAFLRPGMRVTIPATTLMYLRSSGCKMAEAHMNCVAEAVEDNALCAWGLIRKDYPEQFTVVIDTIDGSPLPQHMPVFVGLGPAEEIVQVTREKLRNKCLWSTPSIITYCSDITFRPPMENESRDAYGFQRGSTITLEYDEKEERVTILRDWIVVGTKKVSLRGATDTLQAIGCFVLLGSKGTTASVFPERAQTLTTVVDNVTNSLVQVSDNGDHNVRLVTQDSCRLPLRPCTDTRLQNRLGYTFVDQRLVQCRSCGISDANVMVRVLETNETKTIAPHEFLVNEDDAITEEWVLTSRDMNDGATVEEGFVLSRLLLILSCLCENESLSHLVMLHQGPLLNVIKQLSSVSIANLAPLDFFGEIRGFVASTANRIRWTSESRRMTTFVPTLNNDDRKRRFRSGMLVHTASGGEEIFKVVARRGETLTLQSHGSNETTRQSYKHCIPIKQCGGKPWYQLSNGLPCSWYEHAGRLVDASKAAENVILPDEWVGELVYTRARKPIKISFDSKGVGKAIIAAGTSEEASYVAVFQHERDRRIVRFCMRLFLADQNEALHRFMNRGATSEEAAPTYAEKVKFLSELETPTEAAARLDVLFEMDGYLDAEGWRLKGTFRLLEGKGGTFQLNSVRRISLFPPSVENLSVEPLPDCVDAAIPCVPPRDVRETMHRLVVLLARHLYLAICNQMEAPPADLAEQFFLFNNHPLAETLLSKNIANAQLCTMLTEVNSRVVDPNVKSWDAASLARLSTSSLFLSGEAVLRVPENLLWDCLHGVITAAHGCGHYHRNEIIRNVTAFVQSRLEYMPIYKQLFSTLFTYVDCNVIAPSENMETTKDTSAVVDLILALGSKADVVLENVSLSPLHCLIDMWHSLSSDGALPAVVDELRTALDPSAAPVETVCTFGDYVRQELKVGKIASTCCTGKRGKYYYEVTLPDRILTAYAIGWGTTAHHNVPGQHVGSDHHSFAYNGSDISTREWKEEYRIPTDNVPGVVVGCLLNMDKCTVAWSLNGVVGPFISLPISLHSSSLFAFASIGTCSGMKVRLSASEFIYAPDGYSDLSGRFSRAMIDTYDISKRSVMPKHSYGFYAQLASFLSDSEEYLDERTAQSKSVSTSLPPEDPYQLFLKGYSLLQACSPEEVHRCAQVIAITESCMVSASHLVDLDEDTVSGTLSQAFLFLKGLVRRSFKQRLLVNVAPLETATSMPTIFIRVTDLYSNLRRTTEAALHNSILAQLFRQIGMFTDDQWSSAPLFKVNLHISGSGHTPVDMGGPYRQVWTFLAFEMMQHPERCFPNSDFHRNPLFVFVTNSQRISLVPDNLANSSFDLSLFTFFGKIMGHSARAKTPLDMDFSPFFWKYLVDDELTIKDYYTHVDSVVEQSVEDDDFLLSGVADELIPGFAASVEWLDDDDNDEVAAQQRRSIAENCLVHSMDEQLSAIRQGLWATLSRRVVRCLSWRDLEKLVCGESELSVPDLQKYIITQLTGGREGYFWTIVEQLSMEQRASLICFASGQRRLPLIRPITVAENEESLDHLPRAQACGSLITIPQYTSLAVFKEKLIVALQHQMEMELA